MVVKEAIPGNAFDIDSQMTASMCAEFLAAGYITCIRYIPRSSALLAGNLTQIEIETILESGLSLGVVQHCPVPGWQPSAALGAQYGNFAGSYAAGIGLPKGMHIFLDLETPASIATAQECTDYANAWFAAVQAAGYLSAVYVGYGLPLSPTQLYQDLQCAAYWRAYNGPSVAKRGFQITQHDQLSLNGLNFDPDIISADLEGSLPMLLYNS